MPIDNETEEKFGFIAELISIEASAKLSSLLNRNVQVSYSRLIDSTFGPEKINAKRDAYMLMVPVTNHDFGPCSAIVSNQEVFTIADLVMGGDGNATEDVIPDETNQMVYAETINSLLTAVFERVAALKDDFEFTLGDHDFRFLQSIKEATLSLPDGTEDSIGIGFKVKIAAKMDAAIQVEINAKAIEFLVQELGEIAETTDVNIFEQRIKAEYNTEGTSGEDDDKDEDVGEVQVIDDSDAYKVNKKRNLGFLKDINMELIVELGRSEMVMKEVLQLTRGSAIELDRMCSEPVDLYIHNQLVARGEVVAIDDSFGLKITELTGNINLAGDIGLLQKK